MLPFLMEVIVLKSKAADTTGDLEWSQNVGSEANVGDAVDWVEVCLAPLPLVEILEEGMKRDGAIGTPDTSTPTPTSVSHSKVLMLSFVSPLLLLPLIISKAREPTGIDIFGLELGI